MQLLKTSWKRISRELALGWIEQSQLGVVCALWSTPDRHLK